MGGTIRSAGALDGALSRGLLPNGQSLADIALASGSDASKIVDAIVEAVRPVDGSLDAEASRRSMYDALSELLDRYPDADISALTESQRHFVIEKYVALDVFNRFSLDNLKALMAKSADARTALGRLNQIKSFIDEVVREKLREAWARPTPPGATSIAGLVGRALRETFRVFEEYL
jgi:hypothetical protein